jgi:hypothetical protein
MGGALQARSQVDVGAGKRGAEGYRRLVLYLEECGLYDELWAIAERHDVGLSEVYEGGRDRAALAARLEIWLWLVVETGRSASEVATLFDRSASSVRHALRLLEKRAALLDVRAVTDTAPTLARLVSEELAPNTWRAIKRGT